MTRRARRGAPTRPVARSTRACPTVRRRFTSGTSCPRGRGTASALPDGEWLQIAFARPVELGGRDAGQVRRRLGRRALVRRAHERRRFRVGARATLEGCRTQGLERRRADYQARRHALRAHLPAAVLAPAVDAPRAVRAVDARADGGRRWQGPPAADASYDDDEAIARAPGGGKRPLPTRPRKAHDAAAVVRGGAMRDLRPRPLGRDRDALRRGRSPSRPSKGSARRCSRAAPRRAGRCARATARGSAARTRARAASARKRRCTPSSPTTSSRRRRKRARRSEGRARCASGSVTATSRSARMRRASCTSSAGCGAA